ncbi:MAG: hypothetical protein M1813_005171 [Trichoglossum hirsutum]|nr:MAG: hypothetical protein M1813_005171 [Trichoglossum hirsutum]
MSGIPPPNRSRLPLYLGLGVAAVGGYYLYSAGGDPKVAQKNIEHDATRASSALRSDVAGREREVKKTVEEKAQRAGSKIDSAIDDTRAKKNSVESKADQYRKDVGAELQQTIDQVDRKVEEGASKAKGGISSWFGGK